MTSEYLIISEEDFINFLDEVKGQYLDSENFLFPDVKFEGWPILDINVKGPKFHLTITSSIELPRV